MIATTSKLMTIGVDAQTCKLIVLDSNIQSMTEFKQIIGRGTRINEAFDKLYFTILDFRNATKLFADKDFDGDPIKIKEKSGDEDLTDDDEEGNDYTPPDGIDSPVDEPGPPGIRKPQMGTTFTPRQKVYVNGVNVSVLQAQELYFDVNGKMITKKPERLHPRHCQPAIRLAE